MSSFGAHAVGLRRVDRMANPSATAVRAAPFIGSGVSLLEGQKGCERRQESVQTDPGGRVIAPAIRLSGGAQRTKRFEPAGEFRSVRLAEARRRGAASRDCPYQAHHRRACSGDGNTGDRSTGQECASGRAGRTDRQERGRSTRLARPTNERGGARSRQNLALSGRAMHHRHPALSGCPDQTVRNSCVRGKER